MTPTERPPNVGKATQWAMAVMMGEEHYRCWGDLYESVRTGHTAFDRLYGKPIFEYFAEHAKQAEVFDAAMTAINGRETQLMLDAYVLSEVGVLAEIGGGNGTNLIGVLGRYPAMRGVLFDLPHVVERARTNIEAAGLAGRCDVVDGDFFGAIPIEADAYFLRHIIHDWDDEKAGLILRNLRRGEPEPTAGRCLTGSARRGRNGGADAEPQLGLGRRGNAPTTFAVASARGA